MKIPKITRRSLAPWQLIAALAITGGATAFAASAHYTTSNLVSDIPGVAAYTDQSLINPWGIVTGIEGAIRVSDEATNVSTIYNDGGDLITFNGTDAGSTHSIAIPTVSSTSGGFPTGVVDNQQALLLSPTDGEDFPITSGAVTRDSHFLYVTEDGVVAGFNPNLDENAAITGTSVPGAGFTGASLSYTGTGNSFASIGHTLFAANFEGGTVDVFSRKFLLLSSSAWNISTADLARLPAPPAGDAWSPFNIHQLDFFGEATTSENKFRIRHLLLVTYALHSTVTNQLNDIPEVGGTNYGAVAIFQTDGTYLGLLGGASQELSSPWGIAISHSQLPGFEAPLVILVASHGTGLINAYGIDPRFPGVKKSFGAVKDLAGNDLEIDGLWGLRFRSIKQTFAEYEAAQGADLREDTNHFYFTAGLLDETHGLLGKIFKP